MEIALISAAMQSIGVLKTTVEAVVGTRDHIKLADMKITLTTQLMDLQSTLLSLQAGYSSLLLEKQTLLLDNHREHERVRELERELREREDHELCEVRPGAFVYARKPSGGADHAPPYFCQACKGSGAESAFQLFVAEPGRHAYLACPSGNKAHTIVLGGALPLPPQPLRRSSPWLDRDRS